MTLRSDIGLPHATAAPVPGELRQWLISNRRAWDGWPTWSESVARVAAGRLTKLHAAGLEPGWPVGAIDSAISSIRGEERRAYARRAKDGAW